MWKAEITKNDLEKIISETIGERVTIRIKQNIVEKNYKLQVLKRDKEGLFKEVIMEARNSNENTIFKTAIIGLLQIGTTKGFYNIIKPTRKTDKIV